MKAFISPMTAPRVVRHQGISTKSVAIRNRHIRRVLWLFAMGSLLLLVFVWTRVRVLELGYEVTSLHRDVAELIDRRAKIQSEIAALKSPERMERIAREQFGMRLPRGDEIIFVTSDEALAEDQSYATIPHSGR